jgi:hypothetical protein
MEDGRRSKMEDQKSDKEFMEKQKRMHPIAKSSSSHYFKSFILNLAS